MDVRGVGQGPSSFQPMAQDPAPLRAKPEAKPVPLELLGDRRLSSELESLGLPPEPGRMNAARALIATFGTLEPKLLSTLEHALSALDSPTPAQARAAAFLLSKGLPATPQAINWLVGRQEENAGARMFSLQQRLSGETESDPHRAEVLSLLKDLELPEGKGPEVAAALKKLVAALQLPEADLAKQVRKEDPQGSEKSPERLVSMLQRMATESPAARTAHEEVRATQLQNRQETVLPVWWADGSGEIRVQERPEGGKKRKIEASEGARAVLALETPHLQAVRIDLLLSRGQVNCHVAVQDPGVAEFLTERLDDLRTALDSINVRVNSLEVKTGVKSTRAPAEQARGVDYYG